MSLFPTSAPHAHAPDSVPRIMGLVLLAAVPTTLYGFVLFGWPALNLLLVTVVACLLCEAVCLRLAGHAVRPFLMDGSALLTGVLLALSLPPWAPWWIGAVGAFFAIVVGKQVFGGIGQNIFNPAMLARVALLVSFPVEMTLWLEPRPLFSGHAPGFLEGLAITFSGIPDIDAVSGATILGRIRTELGMARELGQILPGHYQAGVAALGWTGGSLGETADLLVLLGGLWLLWRRVMTWHVPVAMLATVLVLAGGLHLLNPERFAGPAVHLLSGGLMLGAFFIATDPVTSPTTKLGQLIFGAGCGAFVYIIRPWGGYHEGVAIAVVLMNAATPLIDHYVRPRIYGRTWRGQSRPVPERAKRRPVGSGEAE